MTNEIRSDLTYKGDDEGREGFLTQVHVEKGRKWLGSRQQNYLPTKLTSLL